MKLYIKNMVCIRCKMILKQELEKLNICYLYVELGKTEIVGELSFLQKEELQFSLLKYGLEILEDKKSILIEHIKKVIVELIHYSEEPLQIKFSEILAKKLNHNYTYLANLFSEVEGITIEHFIIMHKIEKVKELIVYNEFSIKEIAYKLHYSSIAHLSRQFKKITGLTPSHFRALKENRRAELTTL